VRKKLSIKNHPLTYTAVSLLALFLLVFAVSQYRFDIRRTASEPSVKQIKLNLSEVVIVYCRGERMSVSPSDFSNNDVTLSCLGSLVDGGDPDIRETGADRFVIMSPDDVTKLSCGGQLESFTLKEGVGYQIFCN
jgi:hypothetical protein